MALEIATVAALGGLIVPVYAGLWSLNGKVGEVAARTEHNEQAVERISTAVEGLSDRATRVDARSGDPGEGFSGAGA